MDRLSRLARMAGPLVMAWLAVHAVLLALLAIGWGLAVMLKAVLGWLFHAFAFLILLAGGVLLAVGLWKVTGPRRLPRPA